MLLTIDSIAEKEEKSTQKEPKTVFDVENCNES